MTQESIKIKISQKVIKIAKSLVAQLVPSSISNGDVQKKKKVMYIYILYQNRLCVNTLSCKQLQLEAIVLIEGKRKIAFKSAMNDS